MKNFLFLAVAFLLISFVESAPMPGACCGKPVESSCGEPQGISRSPDILTGDKPQVVSRYPDNPDIMTARPPPILVRPPPPPNPTKEIRQRQLTNWNEYLTEPQKNELIDEFPSNTLWIEFQLLRRDALEMCEYYKYRGMNPQEAHIFSRGVDDVPLLFNRYRAVALRRFSNCGFEAIPDSRHAMDSARTRYYDLKNGAVISTSGAEELPEKYLTFDQK